MLLKGMSKSILSPHPNLISTDLIPSKLSVPWLVRATANWVTPQCTNQFTVVATSHSILSETRNTSSHTTCKPSLSVSLWPFDLRINACQRPAIEYTCTKFAVDSSRHFTFRVRTHRKTHTQTDTITDHPTTHQLPPAWVMRSDKVRWAMRTLVTMVGSPGCADGRGSCRGNGGSSIRGRSVRWGKPPLRDGGAPGPEESPRGRGVSANTGLYSMYTP